MFEQMLTHDDGFGEATIAELAELRKALEIGTSQPVTGFGFDALRVESLESTLKLLTYSAQHVRLWNQIPKQEAFSTVEEYNRLITYGTDGGGFVPSGALPEEEDTLYERADQKVKYIGSTRSVHHPATLVRTIPPDLIGQETQNGALWIMGKVNRALYYADEAVIPLEFTSLTQQIIAGGGNVFDLAGAGLDGDTLNDAAQIIVDNFGIPQKMFSNSKVFTDFDKAFHDSQRWASPGATVGIGGTPLSGWRTLVGEIGFEPDVFVTRGSGAPTSQTNQKAPNPPALSASGIGANAASKFVAADAGDYIYQVTAVNSFGESAASAATAAQALAAGQSVDISIADGGGTFPATGYKIYRTEVDGTETFFTNLSIPRAKVGGAPSSPTVFTDVNEWRPRTTIGLILDMTNQSLSFKQLAPMMKMNLAVVSPAIRWMQLLYGTPIVYAPKKNVVIKNIGNI